MNSKQVLLVTQDNKLAMTLSANLTAQGMGTVVADDGAAALSTVRSAPPDLILLDKEFPPQAVGSVAWDAFLILTWLRRIEEARDVPVILLNQDSSPEVQERAAAGGVTYVFPAPLQVDQLVATIAEVLAPTPVPAS
ncbi:MAG: response regulator [Limisphaerales bacterium]